MTTTEAVATAQDVTTITCPHCHRRKRVKVGQFKDANRALRVKCACTFVFAITLRFDADSSAPDVEMSSMRTAPAPSLKPDTARVHRLTFHGSAWTVSSLSIVHVLFTLGTAGLYQPWGMTRLRRYLSSQTRCNGEPFIYHGTGQEVLRGWLKAIGALGLPLIVLRLLPTVVSLEIVWYIVLIMIAVQLSLGIVSVVRISTYRSSLSRFAWRGIRFAFHGRTTDYCRLYLHGLLLTFLTLGAYAPIFAVQRFAYLVSYSVYGNRAFSFDGKGKDLVGPYLAATLLSIPTCGLSWLWYDGIIQRYCWNHTTLGNARFRFDVTGGTLFLFRLSNTLLMAGSLFLAWPWVRVRELRFMCRHLTLHGALHRQPRQPIPG